MEEFATVLMEVSVALLYMLPALILSKLNKMSTKSLGDISFFLLYVCASCLVIDSFWSIPFSKEIAVNMAWFFLITFVLQLSIMLFIYFVFGRNKKHIQQVRLLSVGTVAGNVGFLGLPVVVHLFPGNPEVASYSCIYSVTMNIVMFTVGILIMTGDKKFMTIKHALLNPATISFLIGLPLFMFGVKDKIQGEVTSKIVGVLANCIQVLGKMTTPLCMIILGVRLGKMKLKPMVKSPLVYIMSLLKLVIFPLFCYLVVYFLPLSDVFKASMLILSATPCASMILNFAEMHNVLIEDAANSAIATNLFAIITMPLLALLI